MHRIRSTLFMMFLLIIGLLQVYAIVIVFHCI